MLEEEVPTELKVLLTLSCSLMSLSKHTTEDPTPGCLSRRRIARMIYFLNCECCISISKSVRKHATSRIRETESPN